VNKELRETIETIIKTTIKILDESSDEEADSDLMVGIFRAEDGEIFSSENQSNEEEKILQRDNIRRVKGRIEKFKAVRLEKIELNKQSWSKNWQADLLRESKALKKAKFGYSTNILIN